MSAAPETAVLDGYRSLVAHAELELQLLRRGDVEGLAALAEGWQRRVAELPPKAPLEAAPLLARARLIHERTREELLRRREQLIAEAGTARRARRTAAGYAREAGRPGLERTA